MIGRCCNSNDPSYNNYGGRGISVCKRWHSFSAFFEDMGRRPSRHHSIDRINNDSDYEPSNCRWATQSEQANNKRSTVTLTVDGETLSLTAWAQRTGIPAPTIRKRLKSGWDDKKAVQTPVDPQKRNKLAKIALKMG